MLWLAIACSDDSTTETPLTGDTGTIVALSYSPSLVVTGGLGEDLTITIAGGPPDSTFTLWSGSRELATPDCTTYAPLCVSVAEAAVLASPTTDAAGEATLTVAPPEGSEVWLQAGTAIGSSGFVSNVVNVVLEAPLPTVTVSLDARPGIHDLVAVTTVTGLDPAQVTLSYRWRVDGIVKTEFTRERVTANEIWPGQEWGVEVTPSDPWNVGKSATAFVTIPEPPGSNVIVVLFDDLGAEKLALYEPKVPAVPTPTFDALAAEGVVFNNAYAAPMCSAARANLLTGRHARRNGLGFVLQGDYEMFPLEGYLLPEALEQARTSLPWTSVALGKWNLSSSGNAPDIPNQQGFDWFAGTLTVMSDEIAVPTSYYNWPKHENGVDLGWLTVYNTTDTIDDAIEQVNTLPQPFFLYLPLNAPHDPLHVPPFELFTEEDLPPNAKDPELYRAVLQAADTELGRFLDAIPPDVRANTTIIVTSDNGTQPNAVEPPYIPERSKRTVFETGVHVPMIVTGPYVAQPGTRTDALVHIVDVFTTTAEIAGIPLVDDDDGPYGVVIEDRLRTIDGLSLLPYLADPNVPSEREYLFVELFEPNGAPPYDTDLQAVRDENYKLMSVNGVLSLYQLVPGALDDGDDLLADGTDAYEQAIVDRLAAELQSRLDTYQYDGY